MPGMTTMPIFQSAPPASNSGNLPSATIAAASVADSTSISASDPGTAVKTNASPSDTPSKAEAGSAPNSFAAELRRQLAQTSPRDTPAPEITTPLPDLTIALQAVSGVVTAATALSPQPVTVETLLSDLSKISDWRSARSSDPASIIGGQASGQDLKILPGPAQLSPADLDKLSAATQISPADIDSLSAAAQVLPADLGRPPIAAQPSTTDLSILATTSAEPDVIVNAQSIEKPAVVVALPKDQAPPVTGPAKEDATQSDVSLDSLVSVAPFTPSIQSNEGHQTVAGVATDNKRPSAAYTGKLLQTPASLTPVMPRSAGGMEPAPAAPPEYLLETAGKSADFAATQATLTEVPSPSTGPGESLTPETSFEALLAAAQTLNQHRNSGVHAANNPIAPLPVQTPVGAHGWDGAVADKLVWMVGRQEQRAELVLNPPQMGRIEVSISINDGQTSTLLVSANPAVRDALEAALPRLRELLADAGINLGQTQVGADPRNNAGNSSTNDAENKDNSRRDLSKDELSPNIDVLRHQDTPQWVKRGNGLVDVFA